MWRNLGISFLSWGIPDNVLSRKQSSFFWIICLIWSSPKTDPEKKFLNLVFLNRNYLNKYLSSLHLLTYFISLIQSRLRSSFVLLFKWVIWHHHWDHRLFLLLRKKCFYDNLVPAFRYFQRSSSWHNIRIRGADLHYFAVSNLRVKMKLMHKTVKTLKFFSSFLLY